ncbi:hypothetical protein UTI89UKE3_007 [Escherichia phage vB_EcoP-UTI89UKE3]|uniref:Uncharacterized protein n=2 Tax=Vectrevirus TaxID=2732928 RepID=A0AAE8C5L0_9CAUD|nr:hypothetical protein UTI89UKE2_007 [Escherichia phage vB_EcoP-UTI89UKE2]QZI84608.1 hypothetical protein UTI89UKE3_007 [Escherichia phage vB_EcoP-UTI89UKE3]
MYKLVLNAGDYVRNINATSRRYRCRGTVTNVSENSYYVEYSNGIRQAYQKESAHNYLEKIGEVSNQCKCVHDEICDKCARQMHKMLLYPLRYGAGIQTLSEAYGKGKTTLNKDRRNVITGKTQSEMIKQCGTALGVTQFNTRALGKSTGQAMVKIGEAMMHPNVPVRIMDVDHAITEHGTPRRVANKHFADTIEGIIRKQGLKGLHLLNGEELLYLPIVTEETYVNI